MENRFDKFEIKKWRYDNSGNLIVEATPTRIGVLQYRDDNGKMYGEFRSEAEVSNTNSLESIKGIHFTDNHTDELITPDNYDRYKDQIKGTVLEKASIVDGHVKVEVKVFDAKTIKLIVDKEKTELSAGYTCKLLPEKGHFDNEEYSQRQTDIRYNHIALVEQGRAGKNCKINLDKGKMAEKVVIKNKQREMKLDSLSVAEKEISYSEESESLVQSYELREDAYCKELESKDKKIATLQAKFDSQKVEFDALKEQSKDTVKRSDVKALALEESKLRGIAKKYNCDSEERLSGLELKKAIVRESKKKVENFDSAKLENEHYVNASFDIIEEQAKNDKQVFGDDLKKTQGTNFDSEDEAFNKLANMQYN